jgi:hypothetical protein
MRMLRVTCSFGLRFSQKNTFASIIPYFTILYIASVALREGSQTIDACVGRSACFKSQLLLQSFNRSAV